MMRSSLHPWRLAVLSLFFVPLLAAACGTLEVGIVSDTSTARLSPTPSATPLAPLSTPSRNVDATVSALATMNAYLATRVAAQATPARDLEPTVAALATWSSYLATRGPARATLAPDATFTPAPGGPTLTVSPPPPTPPEGSPPTPFCRPAEASVELSASPTRLEIGQTVSVTVTLANGHGSEAKLGLIRYTLEVRPAGALISDEPGPVEHPITLEPGRSDEAAFVLRAAAPGRATLTGSASYEMHALDYSWGSWSGCGSRPLEIVVGPVTEAE